MTAASTGPAFSVHDIPFSAHGSWFDISPVRGGEDHVRGPPPGLPPERHARGPAPRPPRRGDGRPRRHPRRGDTGLLSWTGADGRDRPRLRVAGHRTRARHGAGACASPRRPRALTPFSGTYFYRDPVDGSHVFTSYETGRRYRVTVLSGTAADGLGSQALGAADRGLTVTADDGRLVGGRRRGTRQRATAVPLVGDVRRGRARPRGSRSPGFVDAVAPWRSAATPAAELAAYVLWSATVRPGGLRHPSRRADVQALDGQGLELGPLLQRPRAGPRSPRTGLGPVLAALRPPGRQRCAARLGHPLRGPLQLRQTAHPRLDLRPAAQPAPRAARPGATGRGVRQADPLDATSGSPRDAHPARPCPTTSTATTAAGTTPPPSTPDAWPSPPTSPRS